MEETEERNKPDIISFTFFYKIKLLELKLDGRNE